MVDIKDTTRVLSLLKAKMLVWHKISWSIWHW